MILRKSSWSLAVGVGVAVVAGLTLVLAKPLWVTAEHEFAAVHADPIVGAWNCQIPPAGGAPAFTDIKNIHVGGTQSEIDNAAPPSQESPTVGTWTKTGPRSYAQKAYQQVWDASGNFLGTFHYTGPMELSASLNELQIQGTAALYDPHGDITQSFPFTANCTRL